MSSGQEAARKPFDTIVVTKDEAAFNQILTAIDMLRTGRYECAITLAGAAESMLPRSPDSVLERLATIGVPDELMDSFYADLDRKGRITFWNTERDWLKHCGPSHPNQLEIHRRDAEHMIARALTKLTAIEIPTAALTALRWFWTSYVDALDWNPPDGASIEQAVDRFLGLGK